MSNNTTVDETVDEQKEQETAEVKAKIEAAAFKKLAETPISQEEAQKLLADIELNQAKLRVIRQKRGAVLSQIRMKATETEAQLSMIDEQILGLDLERAMVFRRALNKAPDAEEK